LNWCEVRGGGSALGNAEKVARRAHPCLKQQCEPKQRPTSLRSHMATFDIVTTFLKSAEPLTTVFSFVAAVLSGIAAWLSYRLASSIRNELKSDETLAAGVLDHPVLAHPDHENCVLQTTVFNKSKRKCVISKVQVFDGKGAEIEVDWAERIDSLGNPQGRSQLIGVVDEATICIRRRDGSAFRDALVHIVHSFDSKPLTLTYEMAAGWQQYFAKTN
jgi:hypothetical protein